MCKIYDHLNFLVLLIYDNNIFLYNIHIFKYLYHYYNANYSNIVIYIYFRRKTFINSS